MAIVKKMNRIRIVLKGLVPFFRIQEILNSMNLEDLRFSEKLSEAVKSSLFPEMQIHDTNTGEHFVNSMY